MIIPATLNLVTPRNSVVNEPIQLRKDQAVFNLSASGDLGLWTHCDMQIEASKGDGTPLLTLSSVANSRGSKISVQDAANGILLLKIANADLLLIPEATKKNADVVCDYDIVITFTGGDFYSCVKGSFTVQEGVTTTHG